MSNSPIINIMRQAAFKAARKLIRDFGEIEQLQVSKKGPGNFVSSADYRSEIILKKEFMKAYPDYSFLMEETGLQKGENEEYSWIIDPLDGTNNFLHGIPHFCISIALKHKNEIIAGLILDPIRDETFFAEKGCGAFLNNHRLRVSTRKNLDNAIIGTNKYYSNNYLRKILLLEKNIGTIRQFGSAALDLAYVAAGRFDGYFSINLKPWDIAAGIIIIQEAGGHITKLDGDTTNLLDSNSLIVTNNELHEILLNILSENS